MDAPTEWFSLAQLWLFESALQPVMFAIGLGGRLDQGFSATGWLLVGCIQLAIMLLVIGPLQRWRPVEPVLDRAAVRVDVIYTLIHRLGLFRVALFFTLDPLADALIAPLRAAGVGTFHLDGLWPGVSDVPWVSFVLYLLAFDALQYIIHRGQHKFAWWWRLHSLHHSQRQMTMWTDNRNHLLDDLIRDAIVVVVAQCIGIAPGQFVAVVAVMQLCENLQHANVRLWFGAVGDRLFVSPRFHRVHHSIGIGHESRGKATLGGHNFGVLFPFWDMLLGTADFDLKFEATGVRDQVEQGVEYGQGFWAQQRLGLVRLFARSNP
jgi:sterol desaturase/sphingolipid hydroxylase (fatty acid hydroxylase superfamily)